jgi:hypothetical protein
MAIATVALIRAISYHSRATMRVAAMPADKPEGLAEVLRGLTLPKLRPAVIGMHGTAEIVFAVWDASVPRSSLGDSYTFTGGMISFVLLFSVTNIVDPGFGRCSEKAAHERLRSAEKPISDAGARNARAT